MGQRHSTPVFVRPQQPPLPGFGSDPKYKPIPTAPPHADVPAPPSSVPVHHHVDDNDKDRRGCVRKRTCGPETDQCCCCVWPLCRYRIVSLICCVPFSLGACFQSFLIKLKDGWIYSVLIPFIWVLTTVLIIALYSLWAVAKGPGYVFHETYDYAGKPFTDIKDYFYPVQNITEEDEGARRMLRGFTG